MHKVIYWETNKKQRKVFYFEHMKKFEGTTIFKLGTTDTERIYVPDNKIIAIIWDNSIIRRKK